MAGAADAAAIRQEHTQVHRHAGPGWPARRGFIVVLQDTRGCFASEGEWDPFTSEASDGFDTVRWAAALPHSNGSVGMFGTSYFAYTQWMAASTKPPELKAISPRMTWSDPGDGLFARGGAYELGNAVPWSLTQGFDILARRHADDPAELRQALEALVGDLDAAAESTYWETPADPHPIFERHGIPDAYRALPAGAGAERGLPDRRSAGGG